MAFSIEDRFPRGFGSISGFRPLMTEPYEHNHINRIKNMQGSYCTGAGLDCVCCEGVLGGSFSLRIAGF